MSALSNAFTFILRKNHEHPPTKLIVTKLIRHTLPMVNNKAFLDFIDKISSRLDNKNKKHKKIKSFKPAKMFITIFGKSIPAGSAT